VVSGLLAFMSITGIAGMLNISGLTPILLPPPEIFAGTGIGFMLQLHNSKRYLPSFLIRLECRDGQGRTLALVPGNSVVESSIVLTFPERGWQSIGRIRVSSPFPVNFFTRSWDTPVQGRFIVFPRPVPVRFSGDGDRADRSGSSSRMERGVDGELERITGYSGNEPLRMIHWKHSARLDDLLVKEFGRQSAVPLMIDPAHLPGETTEERISGAAWLVRKWVAKRPVGLRLGQLTIAPAIGRQHGTLLLTELALYGTD
jgi:uncharacterized protein (DUF58 family)